VGAELSDIPEVRAPTVGRRTFHYCLSILEAAGVRREKRKYIAIGMNAIPSIEIHGNN
jgi:hypothetical protein